MYVLGINAYHGDSSACLLREGQLVAASEEERFTRIKHWAGFPAESVRWCLQEADIGLEELDHIAINTDPRANYFKKVGFTLRHGAKIGFILERIKNKRKRSGLEGEVTKLFGGATLRAKVNYVEHHLAHLASAHLVSPFEESVAVSVDGFGDFSSAAWGHCQGGVVSAGKRVHFPHSLGIMYQAMTQFLGFPNYGDEYKVMGLAPYGKPVFLEKLRELVNARQDGTFELNLSYFRHHNEKVEYEWNGGEPAVGNLFKAAELEELTGVSARGKGEPLEQKHRDIAHSVQALYEEVFFNLLRAAYRESGVDRLALAGGCAMNSVANGKVYQKTPFRKMYVQSAAGDAGGAIGSAFYVWQKCGGKRSFVMDHAYWGPGFSNEAIAALLSASADRLDGMRCRQEYLDNEGELCRRTAKAIADGKVIGWFQGRMEWGPRALGNRSILGDPRRTDMKDILNLKIKRRESFRPFAPSILRESVPDWFETDDDVPFMMQVYQIREDRRPVIPAVTHVDGSGRLQTVRRDANPRYYGLIEAFRELTGVPILLNTSFNENEPVVCRPEEALDCFLRTRMDVLVLGNHFIERAQTGD